MKAKIGLLVSLGAIAAAQDRPEFDAASVKPNTSARVGIVLTTSPGGEFEAQNVTLQMLIGFAYDLKDFQVAGGPKWIAIDRYDILAKPPVGADPPGASTLDRNNRNRARMQTLLADRFQLQVHREAKDLTVYALVVAKGGPHLTAPTGDSKRQGITGEPGKLVFTAISMSDLAKFGLAPRLGTIVLDQTGISGQFSFELQFADDNPGKPGIPSADQAADPSNPPLAVALQEQLGLKLERRKAPVEVLVVDRAEKASAN